MDAVQRDSSFMVLQMVEWDTGTGVERLELYNSLNSKFSKIRLSCQPAFLISAAIQSDVESIILISVTFGARYQVFIIQHTSLKEIVALFTVKVEIQVRGVGKTEI